jgi:type I restriction enzyme M protein
MRAPRAGKTIADPACGTGGFFLAAYDFLATRNPAGQGEQKAFLKARPSRQRDRRRHPPPVPDELFLHNIGEIDGEALISPADALMPPSRRRSTTCWPIRPSARRAA